MCIIPLTPIFAALAFVCLMSPPASGQDVPSKSDNWNHWRGPHQNGASTTADPPVRWGEDENLHWKTRITGAGNSTPIIHRGQVILSSAESIEADNSGSNLQRLLVSSFDQRTGALLWQRELARVRPHESGHASNTHASASPVTDGQRLYVSFGSHGIYCLDLEGHPIWETQLGKMRTRRAYGEGGSPAIADGTLVIPWDHEEQSFLYALDAETGEQRWRVKRDEPTTWATPLLTRFENHWQVIMNGSSIRSYALGTGELIWRRGRMTTNPIPSPVRNGDDVICMTGYRGYSVVCIPLLSSGELEREDDLAWTRSDAAPYVASPVLWKETLYFTKSREGILAAVDARDGRTVIPPTRAPGLSTVYASPVAAKDRIYFVGRDGTTVVLSHGQELKILATNRIDQGVDASPILSGSTLILRGRTHLYCFSQQP